MGQEEVLKFLKTQEEPLTRGEIAKAMNEDPWKTSRILRALLKWDEVKCVEIDRWEAFKRCGSKRRINLYYVE